MQYRFSEEMTLGEVRQAIFETLCEFEDEHAIHHARSVALFFTPTDGQGEVVVPRTPLGKAIEKVTKSGAYKPAADKFVP